MTNSVAYLTTNAQGKTAWFVPAGFRPEVLTTNLGASVGYSTNAHYWCGNAYASLYYGFSVTDATGAYHPFPGTMEVDTLGCVGTQATGVATDGSGYTLNITASNPLTYALYDRSGNKLTHTISGNLVTNTVSDPDGAQLQSVWNTSTEVTTYTDTLGTTAMTGPGGSGNAENGTPDNYTYTDASGNTQTIQVNYTQYPLETNFGCTGIAEENLTNLTLYFPTSVVLPDGGTFGISYEATPPGTGVPAGAITGRITQLTLPSGGSISYAYTGGKHGINCTSQVVPTLTRTVNDNSGNNGTWTYVNSNTSSTAGNFAVTETDPAGNQTVHSFAGEYQTQAVYHQGTSTVLKTVTTCYGSNGSTPPSRASCPTPTTTPSLPITETDVYTSLGSSSYNEVRTTFDATYGNVTYAGAYDFGASLVTSQNIISYGSWNGSACAAVGNYINDEPCQTSTQDSAGNTYSATDFAYNPKGHPTNIGKWTSASTAWLVTYPSWNSNGTMSQVKDPAGKITIFGYAATGSGGCNGLLLTSTTYPLSSVGSDSQTWDCNGGVRTSYQDVNGSTTTYNYTANGADPLYRIKEVIPPIESPTTYTYHTGSLPWYAATTQLVWGSYYAYHQVNLDGLGRPVSTTDTDPNSPTNYRYAITKYNSLGQVASVTNPYFCDGTNCSPADATYGSTTYNYDALGRVADVGSTPAVALPDGNTNHIVYTNRAKLFTDGAGIQRAYQSDGLGRLQYVCDGIGSVAQANNASPSTCSGVDGSPSGFLATYGYDALNDLTSANVGAHTGYSGQTRSFTYDGLSRMLTSTNPESGTVANVYDTGSAGDLFT
ncbi:MAG: hypothetical protein WB711_20645, partial [Terriglobales bacterium]